MSSAVPRGLVIQRPINERSPSCRTYPIIVSLPIADGRTSFAFYREGLGFEPIGETAEDGAPEPLQFAILAGASLDEREALELWPLVHERYAETFGVDPVVGRQAYARHRAT